MRDRAGRAGSIIPCMPRPDSVRPLPHYRLWLRYDDGVEGEVDLSALVGNGVFAAWKTPGAFEEVTIDSSGAIAWSDELDLCPDSLYLEITGKRPEDILPGLAAPSVRA